MSARAGVAQHRHKKQPARQHTDWMDYANCRNVADPEIFFDPAGFEQAFQLCRECPVAARLPTNRPQHRRRRHLGRQPPRQRRPNPRRSLQLRPRTPRQRRRLPAPCPRRAETLRPLRRRTETPAPPMTQPNWRTPLNEADVLITFHTLGFNTKTEVVEFINQLPKDSE